MEKSPRKQSSCENSFILQARLFRARVVQLKLLGMFEIVMCDVVRKSRADPEGEKGETTPKTSSTYHQNWKIGDEKIAKIDQSKVF